MITVSALIEETSACGLLHEHGLSLYIETKNHNILFDTGQTGAFADNAEAMGIDLKKVDIAVVSHAHYDHTGGLERFFKENKHARVYANERVFLKYYSADGRYIGADESLKDNGRFIFTGNETVIDDELYLFTGNMFKRIYDVKKENMSVADENGFTPDDFLHEQYLLISDAKKTLLVSGCSHKGIMNIVSWCSPVPDYVISGFHFMNVGTEGEDGEYIKNAADVLLDTGAKYFTCHCTGAEQYALLKKSMGGKLKYLRGGDRIIFA